MGRDNEQITEMPDDDMKRINDLLRKIGGPNVVWGAAPFLDVWMTEHRMRSEARASARLALATWVLAVATVVLAFATVALVVATVAHGG